MPPRGGPLLDLRLCLPPEPGTVRERTVRRRVWGLCAALLGAVMLFAGASGPAIVPSLIEDEKAFGTATSCAALSSPHDDCLHSFEATVTRTVIKEQNKSSEYTLYLNGPTQVPHSIDMGTSEPLLEHLRPGDHVTVTLWRDYATGVRQGKVFQETADTPAGEPIFVCALALAVICGGAYGRRYTRFDGPELCKHLHRAPHHRGCEVLTGAPSAATPLVRDHLDQVHAVAAQQLHQPTRRRLLRPAPPGRGFMDGRPKRCRDHTDVRHESGL